MDAACSKAVSHGMKQSFLWFLFLSTIFSSSIKGSHEQIQTERPMRCGVERAGFEVKGPMCCESRLYFSWQQRVKILKVLGFTVIPL